MHIMYAYLVLLYIYITSILARVLHYERSKKECLILTEQQS